MISPTAIEFLTKYGFTFVAEPFNNFIADKDGRCIVALSNNPLIADDQAIAFIIGFQQADAKHLTAKSDDKIERRIFELSGRRSNLEKDLKGTGNPQKRVEINMEIIEICARLDELESLR